MPMDIPMTLSVLKKVLHIVGILGKNKVLFVGILGKNKVL